MMESNVVKVQNKGTMKDASIFSSRASAPSVDAANMNSREVATTTGIRFSVQMEARINDGSYKIHSGMQCDRCGMLPISGPRFKSCRNPNYDLCLKCFEATSAEENELCTKIDRLCHLIGYRAAYGRRMRKLQGADERMCRNPDQGQNPTQHSYVKKSTSTAAPAEAGNKNSTEVHSARVLHRGVQCDECGIIPIHGPRYKSSTRFNYDVCQSCFKKCGSNIIEYFRIDKPLIIASGHPLVISEAMRRLPPCLRQCSGRWIWVLNQMVLGLAVDEAAAGEKTPAAGSNVKVGGDTVFSPQAEAAAAKDTSTSAPPVINESAPSVAKQANGSTEVSALGDEEKSVSSNENGTLNNAAKTAGVEEEIVQEPSVATDGKAARGEEEAVQAPAVAAHRKAALHDEKTVHGPAVAAHGDLSTKKGLMAKLAAMGFEDPTLNEELLGKYNFDLLRTLDELIAAEEWDPMLGELEELGFFLRR